MRLFSFSITTAIAAALISGTPALAQTAPAPSAATSTAAENPTTTALARAQIDAFRAGKIDRTQYNADANAHITDALVGQVAQLLGRGGAIKTFAYSGNAVQSGVQVTQYAVTFERPVAVPEMPTLPTTADWIESIATDKDGKISYLLFAPKM
ncbi:MAG: hypothetical protein JO024_01725 [Candidatus Eremiobacteraeota bacterium]|nr:hypothetical protein [Candidatus Eremiobacteraeota bacterium]MBV9736897.1 hypothetical protein [Candidatus Eremiobacteraeota bacterium]